MGKVKLIRPIKDKAGAEDIGEVTIKDEKDITASDFFEVSFNADGSSKVGTMADTIANLCNLTDLQVASMHPKDYLMLSAEVSSFLE